MQTGCARSGQIRVAPSPPRAALAGEPLPSSAAETRVMAPLIGDMFDRFSARPGQRIAVKVSSQLGELYRANLVRIIHGDANPVGPGLQFDEVPAPFAGTYKSRFQPVHSGSCGIVVAAAPLAMPDPCTIVVRVQPWLPDERRQTVLAIDDGPILWITAEGVGLHARRSRNPARRADAEAALVRVAHYRRVRPAPDRSCSVAGEWSIPARRKRPARRRARQNRVRRRAHRRSGSA